MHIRVRISIPSCDEVETQRDWVGFPVSNSEGGASLRNYNLNPWCIAWRTNMASGQNIQSRKWSGCACRWITKKRGKGCFHCESNNNSCGRLQTKLHAMEIVRGNGTQQKWVAWSVAGFEGEHLEADTGQEGSGSKGVLNGERNWEAKHIRGGKVTKVGTHRLLLWK